MVTQRIRFFREHTAALCLAAAAVCLVVTRACLQTITIDEAASYLLWASREYPLTQWYPSSGNHVLNSLLMRLATSVFGVNELTVRIPAILGALIYVGSALYLCLLMTGRKLLQLALLICLIYNPLVLDYLVAARGYSMATGFLLASIAVIANIMIAGERDDEAALRKKCRRVSVFLALSFAANFSFAIADATTMLLFFLWLAARQRTSGRDGTLRLALSCFIPGIVTAFVICGSVVLTWPKGQLYFGSQSLPEMWEGLSAATFDDLNPNVVNPLLLRWMDQVGPALPYVTVFTIVALLIVVEIGRLRVRLGLAQAPLHRVWMSLLDVKVLSGGFDRDSQAAADRTDGLLAFTRLLVVVAVLTLLLHWLAFHLAQLLLPKDRTALFFVTFWTLAFGGALAVRFRRTSRDFAGCVGLGVLIAVAFYFAGCLRLGYFKEWRFDADTKQVYWVLDDLRRECGITDFCTDWRYHVSMNFYRLAYGNTSLKEFTASSSGELPTGKSAYAIFLPTSEEFVHQQGLRVIYHNDESGSAVAIRACPAK
jgi:hypothetical protein